MNLDKPLDSAYVFVSYAHADQALADRLIADLEARGVACWVDRHGLQPGTPSWEQALRDAIRAASAVVLVATSDSRMSRYVHDELSLAALFHRTVYPVWLAGDQWLESIPIGWGGTQYLDARGDGYKEALITLAASLRDASKAISEPAPVPPCPYPGMKSFTEDESACFFGRDHEVSQVLERLRLHPFLAVIGPSGSGKSSLVFAGLIPALRSSRLFGAGAWSILTLRPGETPLAALSAVLGRDSSDPAEAVADFLAAQPEGRRLLVVIDQFEEVFTLAPAEATPFQQIVLRLAGTPRCYVVLTIRADFYPDVMTSPLWPSVQVHRVEVTPLVEEGLRQAIIRPAERVGVRVETALVERLVRDAAGEPGALPLVQETLVLLWERLESRFLPLDAYEALTRSGAGSDMAGRPCTGLQVAMARRADAALAELEPGQRILARRIFLRLVQFGEGRADTRRQQPISALGASGDEPEEPDRTVRHLADRRLLTLSGDVRGMGHKVDIAHEALITGWPAFRAWLSELREAEQTRRRLEDKAGEWVRLGQGKGGLLDASDLPEAERWLASPDAPALGYAAALPALVQASRAAIEAVERHLVEERQQLAEEQARWSLVGAATEPGRADRRHVRWTAAGVAGLLIAACALLSLRGSFAPVDLAWQHFALRLRHDAGLAPPRASLAIVAYDEYSAQALQVWGRATTARLIDRLHGASVRLIVLDQLYEDSRPGTAELAAAIRRAGNVVLAQEVSVGSSPYDHSIHLVPLEPTIAQAARAVGLVNVPTHSSVDGLYRDYYTDVELTGMGQRLPSLALAAVRAAGSQPTVGGATFLINFAGPTAVTFPQYSLVGVLDGSQDLSALTGKIVLVGDEVAADKDLFPTPVDEQNAMYGVELHAHALNTLLNGDPLTPLPPAGQIPLTFLAALVPAAWALRGRLFSSLVAAACALLALLIGALVLFLVAHTWMDVAAPVLAMLLAPLAVLGVRLGTEERANRDMRALFRRYVPPDMVSRIVDNPAAFGLAGEARDITVLFSDIRSFSALSEDLPPQRLVHLLSRYFTTMVDEIQAQSGTVDKYVGDKIMAFFGAPDPQPDAPARAVRAALNMQRRLALLNREFAAEGYAPIAMRIVLHHGPAAVGVMGAPSKREYSAIGDTVNTTAQLADAARSMAYSIVATAAVVTPLPADLRAGIVSDDLGELALKGQTTKVRIYGLGPPAKVGRGQGKGAVYNEDTTYRESARTGAADAGVLSHR